VSIRQLKTKLGKYVRLAAAGETVLVTDGDRVVAELVPPHAARGDAVSDAVLAEVVRCGWMTPAASRGGPPPPQRPVAPFADLISELDRDRADR